MTSKDDVSWKKSFCNNLFIPWKTLLFFYFSSIFVLGATVVFLDIITGWWGLSYLDYLLILGVFGFISWVFY